MSSTRFASKNLRYTADAPSYAPLPVNARNQGIIRWILLVWAMLWVVNGHNFVSAQQAKIAIVLPSVTPQTSEGDVQYARSVSNAQQYRVYCRPAGRGIAF